MKKQFPIIFFATDSSFQLASYNWIADGSKYSALRADGSGYVYKGDLVYERSAGGTLSLDCVLTTGGRIVANKNSSGTITGYTVYHHITDHLGSVRAITNASTGNVVETSDFLPFGTRWSQTAGSSSSTLTDASNRWRYSGKEEQKALNSSLPLIDYGARMYDPTIARWMSVDPMAEKYYEESPYSYCADRPLIILDPEGTDPIYYKNIWGKVKLIGDDGKNSTGSYLVRGSVARDVKRINKSGGFYSGNMSESDKVMHIPTYQRLEAVMQSYENTKESQRENGGHAIIGDTNVIHWDEGPAAISYTDNEGNQVTKASLQMFVVNGINTMPVDASNVEMWWHTHPNTTIDGISLGSSNPSSADYRGQTIMAKRGYKGNTFVIGVRSGTVTFFNNDRTLETVKWKDFVRMGEQKK